MNMQQDAMSAIDRALRLLYNHVRAETLDSMLPEDLASIIISLVPEVGGPPALTDVETRIAKIRQYRTELSKLRNMPLIAQRSSEWYELRKKRLTASDTAQAIGKGKFGSRSQLIQKKSAEMRGNSVPFKTMPAMKWGIMFEEMAMRCYQQRNDNIAVYEFGLIPHPTLECYGASPDGITELGIMTEIKCPYKRKITGEVPDYYELQMQGQMAVCGLGECDYIECDMQVYDTTDEYVTTNPEDLTDHGVICEFTKNGETIYFYSDPYMTPSQALTWAREFSSREMKADSCLCLSKLHCWRLRQISVQRVWFDNERWTELVPQLEQFWEDVCNAPQEQANEPSVKKKYKFVADDSD